MHIYIYIYIYTRYRYAYIYIYVYYTHIIAISHFIFIDLHHFSQKLAPDIIANGGGCEPSGDRKNDSLSADAVLTALM